MPNCVKCAKWFTLRPGRGRPAKKCPDCRERYGSHHKSLAAETRDEAVGAICPRCNIRIEVGEPVDLDHADDNSGEYLGWSHRSCNRSAGAARGNRLRAAAARAAQGRPPVAPPAFPAGSMHRPPSPRADTPPGRPSDYQGRLSAIGEIRHGGAWWRWESGAWVSGTGCSRVW